MQDVRFVTDSTANLPDAFKQQYDVTIVPVYVIFGDQSFKDYSELSVADFCALARELP